MSIYCSFEKSAWAALPLAFGLLAAPAAAQHPPPAPPDLTLPDPLPQAAAKPPPEAGPCRDLLSCRPRLVGELWKKGGAALDITALRW